MMDEMKTMPFGAVWDYLCARANAPLDHAKACLAALIEKKLDLRVSSMGLNPRYMDEELAGLMMSSSHKPKAVILHGLIPKTEFELKDLEKTGIKFCNQNTMDDEGFRLSNKKLVDFVADECRKYGLVKK